MSSPDFLRIRGLNLAVRDHPEQVIGRGIDFAVGRGERVGLVGESGSGKTMTALSVMRLQPPAIKITAGRIDFEGIDLTSANEKQMTRIRGKRIAMVYQNPLSSLNPVRTVGWQIAEAIRAHESVSRPALRRRIIDLLGEVGIAAPERRIDDYPHEFSGGMRQRVVIAMAISCEPDLLLADEPTTALDVTTQARILELLDRMVAEREMAIVFVTHDLAVAEAFCDRIDVMYAGRIVESASAVEIVQSARHPYSVALVGAQCSYDLDPAKPMPALAGQPPVAGQVPGGCAFHPRCPLAVAECAITAPVPTMLVGSRMIECHVRGVQHG
jgi:peptide/nickel transport system ATP-binding protein